MAAAPPEPAPPERLLTGAFLALALSELAYFVGSGMLVGVTAFFVTGPLGSDDAGVGLAFGAFSVATLVVRPAIGRWSDRHGRRRMLLAGATLYGVVVLGHLTLAGLGALVALRVVLGVAEALYFVAGFTVLADLAPPGRAGEALSLASLSLFAGIALGPGLGQALLEWRGFDAVWWGIAALMALALALATRVPETAPAPVPPTRPLSRPADDASPTGPAPTPTAVDAAPPQPHPRRGPLLHPAAVVPGIALFTGVAASAAFTAFGGQHADSVGMAAWSSVLLVYGAVVVGARIAFATLPDRRPPLPLAAAALGVSTVGLAVLGAVRSPTGVLVGAALIGLGTAFLTPAIFAAVFASVPPTERGAASGTVTVFIDLALSLGPAVLGLVAARFGVPAGFAIGAVLPVAGAALLVVARRSQRQGSGS